ncbi:hypothetical protein F2Q68_00034049 [Brassica cretica]|uniref:Knottin scorpion toxin-like domain-containing protein n=2 Tax=Brassica cretica TaxID=69181 RepID=A0A8S9H4D6_BRACR|nr:hypothetical protein F2Q68_00034049 [Brassica cretica]
MKTPRSSCICETSLLMVLTIFLLFILGQASAMGVLNNMICFNGVPYACPDKCDVKCKENGFNGGICVTGSLKVAQCCCDKRLTPSILSYLVKPPPSILSYPVKPPPSILSYPVKPPPSILSYPVKPTSIMINIES